MADLKEVAEKKLKSRIRKFKKVNKDENEKQEFLQDLGASVEIFFPTANPEESADSILLYTTLEGKVVEADYSYNEENEFEQVPIDQKDLEIILETIKDDFKLELIE